MKIETKRRTTLTQSITNGLTRLNPDARIDNRYTVGENVILVNLGRIMRAKVYVRENEISMYIVSLCHGAIDRIDVSYQTAVGHPLSIAKTETDMLNQLTPDDVTAIAKYIDVYLSFYHDNL